MSLFPAYDGLKQESEAEKGREEEQSNGSSWLENRSFTADHIVKIHNVPERIAEISSISSDEQEKPTTKKESYKKNKHHKKRKTLDDGASVLEFHNEEFYVDKKPAPVYKTIRTLHKPACPRYQLSTFHIQKLGTSSIWLSKREKWDKSAAKRYFQLHLKTLESILPVPASLKENEYVLQMGKLNRQTMEIPGNLEPWLKLVHLQEINPYRWSRLMLAEKQLDYVQRALVYHPRCEALYRLYINIINETYPSFEVSKMLDKLLAKDSHNYMLWTAQIMTTQGSMARCIVPDVLRIYERCMQKMHHHNPGINTPTDAAGADATVDTDEVMLKLFNNCALFLRQAGLYEQFFALIKLALELNVSTDQFGDFTPLSTDQLTLIEYEELILQSGLPMNEIWLRIEKLRQGFNFLPCSPNTKCADPQRIVLNEDVCHYIYPIKQRENSFYLILLILRLLKLPFVQCDTLAKKFCARVEDIGDSDAIEDILSVCVRHTYVLPQQDEYFTSLYELTKEMAVSPTYLNNHIGHEIYTRCLTELLLNCATVCGGIDERKRIIFILLWCRFERMLLVLQRCSGKLCADYIKAGRNRYKALLKKPENRNVLHFYTEFALYEFEALSAESPLDHVCRTFDNIIAAHSTSDEEQFSSSDLCYMYVVYAEMLICRGLRNEALEIIITYVLGGVTKQNIGGSIGAAIKLCALQRIGEKLDSIIAIERNVNIMVLEQYLIPDYTVALLKLRTLLLCLIGQKLEALAALDKLLETFRRRDSDRHNFLRENVYELYVTAVQMPCASCVVPNTVVSTKLFSALAEYPRNLFLLQRSSVLNFAPWYKLRAALLRDNPSISTVIFIILAARYRFVQTLAAPKTSTITGFPPTLDCDPRYNETVVRNRLLSLFNMLTTNVSSHAHKALHRNALFWRFYLRCISDHTTAFRRSKQCLLTALDECPWAKALYLDGVTYVPQELSHLQDLIIEKQLRMYALPEELEILRGR